MPSKKSIILFRHAKSDWDADYARDHDRPLAKRGINAAKTMGKILADASVIPDLVLCSTATRARQTLDLASKAGHWQTVTQFMPELYGSSVSELLSILHTVPQNTDSVMLVGHEPTWSALASALIGGGNLRFPTAAMAHIEFFLRDWNEVSAGSGQLRWLLQPRFFD